MKYIGLFLILICSINSAFALDFSVGSKAQSVTADELNNLLRQGKDNYKGSKIIISKDAKIPQPIEKKWVIRKLSGESVPEKGEPSESVIYIKSF